MKKFLPILLLTFFIQARAQITTPVIKAGFGVDGELRANFYNNFIASGNDDWFNNGTLGTGSFVIDTTGAAARMTQYLANPASRKLPFYRTMRVPQFSLVNNRLWIDAVYIRDYNGQAGGDSTAFVMSNKNGDSPKNWNGGVTSVLDKNDIGEMMIHVRRAGPAKTDSLWFIGGISLQGTSGSRYLDFELYQTDIFYTRSTGKFTNYGPDSGHTAWLFDAAGNIIRPGDVIFTAEYSSSSLTNIEARIWVHQNSMMLNPVGFDWIGNFDGASASSVFGYANIKPKTNGAYYTGLQSTNGTWAGPFGFIDGGNNVVTTYTARQFMEFSVNLTKLGLDPITLLGGSACGLPFRRILVKTRSSTSFSAELKDFIGPFDFFTAAPVQALADVPIFCGVVGVSQISVTNPASASVYTWSTPDGNIVTNPVASSITVNAPGTYIVTQQLLDGCSSFASDTVVITYDATCFPLQNKLSALKAAWKGKQGEIRWTTLSNEETLYTDVQRSLDGVNWETIGQEPKISSGSNEQSYVFVDPLEGVYAGTIYYRLKVRMTTGQVAYSAIVKLEQWQRDPGMVIYPNPVNKLLQISMPSSRTQEVTMHLFDASGALVKVFRTPLQTGGNLIQQDVSGLKQGAYMLYAMVDNKPVWKKFLICRPEKQ